MFVPDLRFLCDVWAPQTVVQCRHKSLYIFDIFYIVFVVNISLIIIIDIFVNIEHIGYVQIIVYFCTNYLSFTYKSKLNYNIFASYLVI